MPTANGRTEARLSGGPPPAMRVALRPGALLRPDLAKHPRDVPLVPLAGGTGGDGLSGRSAVCGGLDVLAAVLSQIDVDDVPAGPGRAVKATMVAALGRLTCILPSSCGGLSEDDHNMGTDLQRSILLRGLAV
jgi:hypothetical protein